MTTIVLVSYMIIIFTSIFSCWPFSANWAINDGAAVPRCQIINSHTFIHTTVLNVFTDLLIMGMPFLVLRLYALQLRDVWRLSFLLFLGSISIIAATVRAVNIAPIDLTINSLVNIRKVEILSFGELLAVFFAACAPPIRAFIHRNRKKEETSRYLSGIDRSSITGTYELEGVISLELSTKQLPEVPGDGFSLMDNKAREPTEESIRECDIGAAVSSDDG
ncbi:hypothetical protein L873DRAFT_460464 [Choiromyces venosus 120613-1]|uniref:Rhodopsin domain-containing protein n=1 Tax=Choiromyces venosus 120613-1 TaxID=1336337 RepID=A0A3N4JVM0_9PEZI|nr:hypothetical protein L873DRAFT_460464 [Choiromyces venosus 120613-1]